MSGFMSASANGHPAKPTAANVSAFTAQAQHGGRPPTAVAPSASQPPHHQPPAQGSPVAVSCLPIDPLNVKQELGVAGRAQSLPFGSRPAALMASQPVASSLQVSRGMAPVHTRTTHLQLVSHPEGTGSWVIGQLSAVVRALPSQLVAHSHGHWLAASP